MNRKRRFSTFSLSFLDIMSCGFGAVALVFLIIKHDVDNQIKTEHKDLLAEVNLLAEEVRDGKEHLVLTRNTLSDIDQQLVDAQGLASRINDDSEAIKGKIRQLSSGDDNEIERIKQQLKKVEAEKKKLEEDNSERGNDILSTFGQGDRQYLTGLKLGGARILILLDASASMLDNSLVNIIRRRNMSDNVKRASQKWRRSVATVEWISAQLPPQSQYQIYTFNTKASSIIPNTTGQWLEAANREQLEKGISQLQKIIPSGGTSLATTFQAINQLPNRPDNIFLITDGLPTQGLSKPSSNTITGPARLDLFNRAVDKLPSGIPINVILAPMEGDPMAAAAFWQLAQFSNGSFMSPSKDWP